MKKYFKVALLSLIVMAVSFAASAQVYVKIRPTVPVIVRPAQPSRAHVWIGEEWEPRGSEYAYVGGHWDAPPHPGWIRVPGRWRHEGRGEFWVPGRWRRR